MRAKEEALVLLEEFKKTEGVNFVSLDTGRAISQETGGAQGSQNSVLFSFNLLEENRPSSSEIAIDLREKFANYSKGKLSVIELSGGPPVGSDVQIKITGDDLAVLNTKADQVIAYLDRQPGVENVGKSIKEGTAKLSFVPDAQRLSENNISVDQLGLQLRLLASGFSVDQNKFAGSDEDLDITLRYSNSSSLVESVDELVIPTQNGNLPISTLGTIRLESNPTLITREGGERTISVSGAVTGGANIAEINQKLEIFANSDLDLPEGYSWGTGGVNQENEESVASILQAMLLSFLLIIVTMVIQFSSFRRAIIVMLVIPLSISGVFVIFALTSTPLSFPALIGVLALFGIVVKNSILIVDKIVENLKHKEMPFIEAISDASASRLEPIALTSLATILGLTPITLTDPLWRGLGGAIIAGLAFSGVIMLFFIPVVYYSFFNGGKSPKRK